MDGFGFVLADRRGWEGEVREDGDGGLERGGGSDNGRSGR